MDHLEGGDVAELDRVGRRPDLDRLQVLEVLPVGLPELEPGLDLPVAGVEAPQPHPSQRELEDLRHVVGRQAGAQRLVTIDDDLDLIAPLVERGRDVLDPCYRAETARRLVGQLLQDAAVLPEELDREIGAASALLRLLGEVEARPGDLREPGADRPAQLLDPLVRDVVAVEGQDALRLVLLVDAVDRLDRGAILVGAQVRPDVLGGPVG